MPHFNVVIERSQVQFQTFIVEAADQKSLEAKLEQLDTDGEFAQIDDRFDEGEVETIEYSVSSVHPTTTTTETFASEDLQDLIDS